MTPEEEHYGRITFEVAQKFGRRRSYQRAWGALGQEVREYWVKLAAAARNAPQFVPPVEAIYQDLMVLATQHNDHTSFLRKIAERVYELGARK